MALTFRHFFFSLIVCLGLSANVRMLCSADEDPLEQEQGTTSTAETKKPIERCAGVDVGKGFGGWRDATQNDAEGVEVRPRINYLRKNFATRICAIILKK